MGVPQAPGTTSRVRINQSSDPSSGVPLRVPSLVAAACGKAVLFWKPRGKLMVERSGIDSASARARAGAKAPTLARVDTREGAMNDREMPDQSTQTDLADESEPARQAPRLSPEEIKRIEDYEDLESLIEEPPDGSLSIISDQDVPGAPG
jgi:hypothetical protein